MCHFSPDFNWSQQCWATWEENMQILPWNWFVFICFRCLFSFLWTFHIEKKKNSPLSDWIILFFFSLCFHEFHRKFHKLYPVNTRKEVCQYCLKGVLLYHKLLKGLRTLWSVFSFSSIFLLKFWIGFCLIMYVHDT